MSQKKISSALISVFDKTGLAPIIHKLNKMGVTFYSTGGTESFIRDLGYDVVAVEDVTGYPSILGGRVKTLHPKIFGGILNRQEEPGDIEALEAYEIPQIDLVIVDLYPFENTVATGGSEEDIVEKIDIGGIALIRAAAKNFKDVICVSDKNDYDEFLILITSKDGSPDLSDRKYFSAKAFQTSSHYDSAIFNYFNEEKTVLKLSIKESKRLRYGENPHQKGYFFGDLTKIFDKLHGKELSYNNLLDVDAAVNLIGEFEETTFVILKHNNACGVASRPTVLEAWKDALAGDPISAFGGVLITNGKVDKATAVEIQKLFFEVLIAPEYDADALEVLKQKKNRIILIQKEVVLPKQSVRTALNGILVQGKDDVMESASDLKPATDRLVTESEKLDLLFAAKICKQTKSNTIVFAKDNTLISSGTGQTSRVDALRQAIEKADAFNFSLKGAAMASDAFFPFPDCVELAKKAGITSVIQPGGSIKDQDSIDYCNANDMAMVITGIRHFKH